MGRHSHILGIAIALVVDNQGKLGILHRLNLLGQRIVAEDVTLHEVIEYKVGRRPYREPLGSEFTRYKQARERVDVAERATKQINLILGGSCILGRDEQDGGHTGLIGAKRPACIQAHTTLKAVEAFGCDFKFMTSSDIALLIGHHQCQLSVADGFAVMAVIHGQCATEGLTCQYQML